MLLESSPTIVYASSWMQTTLLSGLVIAFGGVLVWLAKKTLSDVEDLKKAVTEIRIELPSKYKRLDQCKVCQPIELAKPIRAKRLPKAVGE